jgi:hypothetical protein
MRRVVLVLLLTALALAGLVFLGQRVAAQEGSPTATPQPDSQGLTSAEGSRSPIDGSNSLTYQALSNPYCYQPDPTKNLCYINIRSYQATDNGSSSPYMAGVNISINNKLRLRETLFFESNIYFNNDMVPSGLQVTCGAPNSGGAGAAYGAVYVVKVEPIDSSGATMGYNMANLACPAYAP